MFLLLSLPAGVLPQRQSKNLSDRRLVCRGVRRLADLLQRLLRPLEQAAGKFTVDLKGIIAWELRQAGLAEEHIDTLPLCTACHLELYWSHRKMGDQRGNHAAMIALEG